MLTKAEGNKTFAARLMALANKLTSNHFIAMIVSCIIPLVLVFVIINFAEVKSTGLFWLLMLLCPLMHLLMMRKHH